MADVFFGTASAWMDLLDAVARYYGEGSPQWEAIRSKTISQTEFNSVMKQLPYVDTVTNQNGDVIQYRVWSNYEINQAQNTGVNPYAGSEVSQTVNELNSNVQTTTVEKTSIPMNTTVTTDPQTGTSVVTVEQGAKTVTGGAAATATAFTLKDKILPAMFAVGVLATVAKVTKPELYQELPHFFDLENIKDHDVETWKTFTDDLDQVIGMQVINPNDPQVSTTYIDQNAVSYFVSYALAKGAFNTGGSGTLTNFINIIPDIDLSDYFATPIHYYSSLTFNDKQNRYKYVVTPYFSNTVFCFMYADQGGMGPYRWHVITNQVDPTEPEFDKILVNYTKYDATIGTLIESGIAWGTGEKIIYDGKIAYFGSMLSPMTQNCQEPINGEKIDLNETYLYIQTNVPDAFKGLAWNILYNGTPTGGVNGIEQEAGGTTPDFQPGMSYAEILQQLQTDYPEIFQKAITQSVVQPDGTVKVYTYLPVVMPTPNPNPTSGFDPQEQPISGTQRQADTEIDPETTPETIIQYLFQSATDTRTPDKEDTGEGTTPPVVIPTGSASALYTVYNPTNAEINSFGAWLWSPNFVDQLLKMFNDPMQAIISLHKVFCTPSISGRDDIKVGYLNSGVTANVVDGQYVTVNCGTVNLSEDYKNVFDYPPFTEVTLYLPFVGFVKLDTNDVMRGSINVVYHIDVLTGACLAEVKVTRDSFGGTIYQYSGECSVHYPLSSGSYMGVVTALVGAAGTIASGGSFAPIALRATSQVMHGRNSVERSGKLTGNVGAMGIKKPYLVVQRPQTNTAIEFEKFVGKPANFTTKIGSCTGFISCTEVHIENCNGTDVELIELENLLKSGIII